MDSNCALRKSVLPQAVLVRYFVTARRKVTYRSSLAEASKTNKQTTTKLGCREAHALQFNIPEVENATILHALAKQVLKAGVLVADTLGRETSLRRR